MPSFMKLGQRPTHKERAQPLERQKLGLLEKHKDYSLRAKDFNKKKAYLKTLRQKAADRNEDEFYHKMLSRRGPADALTRGAKRRNFTGTVDGDRGNRALSVDAVRILKTQDLGYVRTMRSVLAKEVRQLEEKAAVAASFAALEGAGDEEDDEEDDDGEDDEDDGPRAPKRRKAGKIVFSADTDERDLAMGEGADLDDADDNFEGFGDGDDEGGKGSNSEAKAKAERTAKLQRKLRAAKQRLKALTTAEDELEIQQIRMAKKATTGAITKSGKKIKIRERKR